MGKELHEGRTDRRGVCDQDGKQINKLIKKKKNIENEIVFSRKQDRNSLSDTQSALKLVTLYILSRLYLCI